MIFHTKKPRSRPLAALIRLAVVACIVEAGCRDTEAIRNYQVEKETRQVTAVPSLVSGTASQGTTTPNRMLAVIIPQENAVWYVKAMSDPGKITPIVEPFRRFVNSIDFQADGKPTWALPDGWTQEENKAAGMFAASRFATLKANDVEITVTTLVRPPGQLDGYYLENVNRWRGQLGLPPFTQNELTEKTETVEIKGEQAIFVDIAGVSTGSGRPPFAGGSGGSGGSGAPGGMPNPHSAASTSAGGVPNPHAGASSASGGSVPSPPSGPDKDVVKDWNVPDHWTQGRLSAFRYAAYEVKKDDQAKVEITVIQLRGQSGSILDNINRWRGEVGLKAVSEEESNESIKTIQVDGREAKYVQLLQPEKSESTLAVAVPKGDGTWFIKLKGDSKIAVEETKNFEDFVETIKLP